MTACLAKARWLGLFCALFCKWQRGLIMTRSSAAAIIAICWFLFIAVPAFAQSEQGAVPSCPAGEVLKNGLCVPDEGKCFPWQEFREGKCVAKPMPAKVTPTKCIGGTSNATGQCACPANTHLDAGSGSCVADIVPARKASDSVVCDGGALTDGRCACPAGFDLMPASGTVAGGGTCVKTNAPNCLGGELTVAGTCFCNGRVTMSGESYALELVGGKCVPKRCPEHTYLKDGKCVASSDKDFGFTCRTGYIPDEANPGIAATGLHCLPDPTFCDARVKRRNGSCPKASAVAIDCFETKCVCRDPHAEWLNYLCQCSAPYRNVSGTCVSEAAGRTAPGPGEKSKSAQASEPSDEPARRRRACGRGMIRTHGACVPARPRFPPGVLEDGPPGVADYPADYYLRRGLHRYRFRGYPIPQQDD
jgi:hypothetical protein